MGSSARSRLRSPTIVGIGGSVSASHGADIALLAALRGAERAGGATRFFGGQFLQQLPLFDPAAPLSADQRELLDAVRGADGLIIATPSLQGNVSTLVQNALDLLERLKEDARPGLDGRAVACVVTGGGRGASVTLNILRGVVYSLRGWPTPLGVALNVAQTRFEPTGVCSDPRIADQLDGAGRQVVEFALARQLYDQTFAIPA